MASPPARMTFRALVSIEATSVVEPQIDLRLAHRNRPAATAASPPARCRRDSPSTGSAGPPAGRLAAQHHDAAVKILPPQHLGGGKSRRAAADDHDPAGRIDDALDARLRLLALLPDDNAVAVALDLPDRERAQRRRAGGFAGAQVETGVVPGTADALAVDQRLRRAGRDNGCNGRRSRRSPIPSAPATLLRRRHGRAASRRRIRTGVTPFDRSGPAGGAC